MYASDFLIIITALCFLACAIYVRVYDGFSNEHHMAVTLIKAAQFVRLSTLHRFFLSH
jgi:hypothetical protein